MNTFLAPELKEEHDIAAQIIFTLVFCAVAFFAARYLASHVPPAAVVALAFGATAAIAYFHVPTFVHAMLSGLGYELIALSSLWSGDPYIALLIGACGALMILRFAYKVPKTDTS